MTRKRLLFFVFLIYVALALLISLLDVTPKFYGLSTVLGTTILGTTVLGTTVLGTTVLGTTVLGTTLLGTTTTTADWGPIYAEALAMGQLVIGLTAICLLFYLQLSDPSYGKTRRFVRELRRSWLPLAAVLVLVFAAIVFFKVWAILA